MAKFDETNDLNNVMICPFPDCRREIGLPLESLVCPHCGRNLENATAVAEAEREILTKTLRVLKKESKRLKLDEEFGPRIPTTLYVRPEYDKRLEEEADKQEKDKYRVLDDALRTYFEQLDNAS